MNGDLIGVNGGFWMDYGGFWMNRDGRDYPVSRGRADKSADSVGNERVFRFIDHRFRDKTIADGLDEGF